MFQEAHLAGLRCFGAPEFTPGDAQYPVQFENCTVAGVAELTETPQLVLGCDGLTTFGQVKFPQNFLSAFSTIVKLQWGLSDEYVPLGEVTLTVAPTEMALPLASAVMIPFAMIDPALLETVTVNRVASALQVAIAPSVPSTTWRTLPPSPWVPMVTRSPPPGQGSVPFFCSSK